MQNQSKPFFHANSNLNLLRLGTWHEFPRKVWRTWATTNKVCELEHNSRNPNKCFFKKYFNTKFCIVHCGVSLLQHGFSCTLLSSNWLPNLPSKCLQMKWPILGPRAQAFLHSLQPFASTNYLYQFEYFMYLGGYCMHVYVSIWQCLRFTFFNK